MRGWIYPTSNNLIDWDVAALAKKDPDDCRFLQQLAMGKKPTYVHLIVPTCLGMIRNEENEMRMIFHIQTFRPSPMQDAVLKRQHKICSYCARCAKRPISFHHTPYQVALHFFGGPSLADDEASWSFDFFFGFLCRSCQTMPRISLLTVDETCYMPLATALKMYGFAQAIHMRRFWDDTIPEADRLHAALVEMYRHRFRLVNEHTEQVVLALLNDYDACHYCQTKHVKKLRLCQVCKAVSFCAANNEACASFASAAHAPLCAHICERRFIDVDEIYAVLRPGSSCVFRRPQFLRYREHETERENYERIIACAPHLADESYASDRLMVEALFFAHAVEEMGDFGQRMVTCGRRDVYLMIVDVLQQQEELTLDNIIEAGRHIFLYYAATRNVTNSSV